MLVQLKIAMAVALAVFLWWGCDTIGDRAVDKYKASQVALQAKVDKAQQDKYDTLAANYEASKSQKEVVYKTLTNTVERIVKEPANQVPCLTPEGVEVANKALQGVSK
jgi:hypothetical protein